jgi:cytoskeletal protein CcmA (bactofilin family)
MWGKQSQTKTPEPVTPNPPQPPRPAETRAEVAAAPVPASRSIAESTQTSRITAGISIAGEITGRENLYIDGEVQGSVRINGAVVSVGPRGRIEADIAAREIEVQGRVHGTLEAVERVRIGASGHVEGEVVAQRVAIEEGAIFRGRVEMLRPGEARTAREREAPRAAAVAAGANTAGASGIPAVRAAELAPAEQGASALETEPAVS